MNRTKLGRPISALGTRPISGRRVILRYEKICSRLKNGSQTYLEPFKTSNPGVRLGSPAVVNDATGLQWLYDFFGACGSGCTVDFLAIRGSRNTMAVETH